MTSRHHASTTTTTPRHLLSTVATADLYDLFLDDCRVPDVAWQSYGGATHFAGTVVTVKCFEDNSRIKELAQQQQPRRRRQQHSENDDDDDHRVMVVDAGGSRRCAVLGDGIAQTAAENRWKGIIIHGCVRDVAVLRTIESMGILALGSTPRKSTRRGEGQVDLPIRLGNVEVNTGDYVVADADGVLFLRPDQVVVERQRRTIARASD